MRIYCDSHAVFEGTDIRNLQRLLMRVRLGQHDLILNEVETFFNSDFFARAVAEADRVEVRELLERQFPALGDRGMDPAARFPGPRAELVPVSVSERTCLRDGEHPVWEIDPATVGEWSEAPLRVLLENDADWNLVAAAVRVYGRPKVEKARQDRFLYPDQRGGKDEIEKSVKTSQAPERIFVIMDSDRTAPGSPEGETQQRVRDLAKSRPNINLFILKKREAENYLPMSIWANMVESRRRRYSKKPSYRAHMNRLGNLRAWQKLSETDKDFVDLEDYFPRLAKKQLIGLNDVTLVPDASILEARAGTTELRMLLDSMEAWL